jgi:hypothetical protein
MRRAAELLVVLAVLVFVAVLYGCGGSGGPAGPSEASSGKPSAAAYYANPIGDGTCWALSNQATERGKQVVYIGGWSGGNLATIWRVELPGSPGGAPTVTSKQIIGGEVYDVDESGRAVGYAQGTHPLPLYYDGTTPVMLPLGDEVAGIALELGRAGDEVRIVGYVGPMAALWEFADGDPPPNPTILGPTDGSESTARSIRDSQTPTLIAGALGDGPYTAGLWTRQAGGSYGWTSFGSGRPHDMNSSGQVLVCFSTVGPTGCYLWRDGSVVPLGTLKGSKYNYWYPWRLNDLGASVGRVSIFGTGTGMAVLWDRNGQANDLSKLAGVSLGWAGGINNSGQIVANGDAGMYLLTPK